VLAVAGQADSVPPSLRAAEAAFAAASAKTGIGSALAAVLAPDAVIVFPSAPVVTGRAKITALLAAQPRLDSLAAGLNDRETWISKDGSLAVAIGESAITTRGASTAATAGTYIVAWTRAGGEWRIAAVLMTGLVRPGTVVLPSGLGPVTLPPAPAVGPAKAFIQADADFARLAGARGAAEAFRSFAAPNAVVQGSAVRRGPDAIAAGIAEGPPSDWEWYPVLGRAASSGDLGFTVGQSSIRPKAGGEASLGKYLTIWIKQPDGSVRFLTDGGNPRPKP
jgi:ketosteroid isomerase-like protein